MICIVLSYKIKWYIYIIRWDVKNLKDRLSRQKIKSAFGTRVIMWSNPSAVSYSWIIRHSSHGHMIKSLGCITWPDHLAYFGWSCDQIPRLYHIAGSFGISRMIMWSNSSAVSHSLIIRHTPNRHVIKSLGCITWLDHLAYLGWSCVRIPRLYHVAWYVPTPNVLRQKYTDWPFFEL